MFVYLAECCVRKTKGFGKNPVKIGVAANLKTRLSSLQTGSPFPIRYIAAIKCKDKSQALELEKYYHKIFRRERMYGEWFKPRVFRSFRIDELLVQSNEHLSQGLIPSDYRDYQPKMQSYSKNNGKGY